MVVHVCNSYIPPREVVVLRIGLGSSPPPIYKTTPHGWICYLGNTTVEERYKHILTVA